MAAHPSDVDAESGCPRVVAVHDGEPVPCGRPTNGILCIACAAALTDALAELPALWVELAGELPRQAPRMVSGPVTSSREPPAPINLCWPSFRVPMTASFGVPM